MEEANEAGIVLIADDSPVNLELLSEALASEGLTLLLATDGTEVLELVGQETPDLILLDAMMPKLDGFETCKQLKQNPSTADIPVIFMTALAETHHKIKGLHAGAVDYITKPFEHAELIMRVRNQILLGKTTSALKKKNLELETEIHERAAAQQALIKAVSELERRTEELHQTQVRLVKLEKQATEVRMAGGFAHEMRNALASTGLRLAVIYRRPAGQEVYSTCGENAELLKELHLLSQAHMSGEPLERARALERKLQDNEKKILLVLSGISSDVERALRVTSQILEYSRYGTEKPGTTPIAMKEVVEALVLDMEESLSKGDIAMKVEADPTCVVMGKQAHFDLMLRNIVLNAYDALMDLPAGAERLIKVGVRPEGSDVLLEVTDSGAGITAENMPRIFEPFFSTKPSSGTGLGLSVVEKLLSLYDGTIAIESDVSRGTMVRIRLPRSTPV